MFIGYPSCPRLSMLCTLGEVGRGEWVNGGMEMFRERHWCVRSSKTCSANETGYVGMPETYRPLKSCAVAQLSSGLEKPDLAGRHAGGWQLGSDGLHLQQLE